MIVDFHCHSTASDGTLTPAELLQRARVMGVELMAITDHDSIEGYLAVRDESGQGGLTLVPGVELSCVWGKATIHVLGLNIDPDHQGLLACLERQQRARQQRALLIAEKLGKYGFVGAYEYVSKLAGDSQIGRPHFAQFLLEQGHVDSVKQAFKRYLGAGKPGDVKTTWPQLAEVVQWITDSGGVAVLAHPLHYKMTATKLRALLEDFKRAGGSALEVVSGRQPRDRTQYLGQLARQFELLASVGSDFHRPDTGWSELGRVDDLPAGCTPVWSSWQT